jgi:hypothetical protein
MEFPFLSGLPERVPDDPFYQPRRPYWLPREMTTPPALAPDAAAGLIERRLALLINPFYPKHPHGSFGKHVLTPAVALTSIAGATPPTWRVQFWDENLLQGPPPFDPLPEVVGITAHLTFAERAYALARWYLAMAILYKRSNRFWRLLIQHRLVHAVWRPLVEWTRLRHLVFRRRLADEEPTEMVRPAEGRPRRRRRLDDLESETARAAVPQGTP